MDLIMRENLYNQVRSWTLDAGALIRKRMHDPLVINTKTSATDLVTELDEEVERFFSSKIRKYYPSHKLLSEEGFGHRDIKETDVVWIIDPIDGTMNFINQKRNFAISVGIYYQGVGQIGLVFDVMANNLFSALKGEGAYKNAYKLPRLVNPIKLEDSLICLNHYWLCDNTLMDEQVMQNLVKKVRGTRAIGSAALEFTHIAEGVAGAYLTMRLEPWDFAAGKIIVEEVGGKVSSATGEALHYLEKSSVLTSHPSIHEEILNDYLIKGKK